MGPEGVITTLGFFMSVIVWVVFHYRTRHIERMEMIRNNVRPDFLIPRRRFLQTDGSLKLGLLLISIGLGLLLGLVFDTIFDTEPAGVFISMLILGGLSLVFYHIYSERKYPASDEEYKINLKQDLDDMV